MRKNNIKYIYTIVLFALILSSSYGQLSIFNKIDTVKGFNTKVVPLDLGFLVFNNSQLNNDTTKFRMSKFNECGDVDWIQDYSSQELAGNYLPDVLKDGNDIFLLLKSPDIPNATNALSLIKMNEDGNITWSKNFDTETGKILSYSSNILFDNEGKSIIYIITNDKENNTVIYSLDRDGDILESKIIEGIQHRSSVIDGDGNLVIFSNDSLYAKVRIDEEHIDSLIWTKKLQGRYFADVQDPLSIVEGPNSNIITAVIDTSLQKDTVIYKLVKFNKFGDILTETDGFYAPDYLEHSTNLKQLMDDNAVPRSIYFMVDNKVVFFDSNLNPNLDPKIYNFAIDSFKVIDASLEICTDISLVMSGFCYEDGVDNMNLDYSSPYMFVTKTQPVDKGFVVEAEEDVCLIDSTAKIDIIIDGTMTNDDSLKMDTIVLAFSEPEFLIKRIGDEDYYQEKCGKVNMEPKNNDPVILCPGTFTQFMLSTLKGATYEWSTGEKTASIVVNKKGTYTATVTLCDTVEVSTFVYKYTDNVDDCFSVLYPNAFFPTGRTDSLNSIFKTFQENEFTYDEFEMKVFDRWGEKVFETTDSEQGWDGTFRGKNMAPGVYLYSVNWKVIIRDEENGDTEYGDSRTGQVMLMR